MRPIVENIENPKGQSFYARRYDIDHECLNPGWHIHPEYELVLVKSGQGKVQVGSYFSTYENGLLIFLGPMLPHMPFVTSEHFDNVEIVVQFKDIFPQEHLSVFPEFSSIVDLCRRSHSGLIFENDVKEELIHPLVALCELPKPLQLCRFLEVLLHLAQTDKYRDLNVSGIKLRKGENDYHRINKVYDYVASHYQSEIKINTVAELVGLTPNSFCRFFKKMTRKSFIQFVNEFRINKAAELINMNQGSISETMYASGYNDPSFFNRQFKKLKGASPSEYRKSIHQVQLIPS